MRYRPFLSYVRANASLAHSHLGQATFDTRACPCHILVDLASCCPRVLHDQLPTSICGMHDCHSFSPLVLSFLTIFWGLVFFSFKFVQVPPFGGNCPVTTEGVCVIWSGTDVMIEGTEQRLELS